MFFVLYGVMNSVKVSVNIFALFLRYLVILKHIQMLGRDNSFSMEV